MIACDSNARIGYRDIYSKVHRINLTILYRISARLVSTWKVDVFQRGIKLLSCSVIKLESILVRDNLFINLKSSGFMRLDLLENIIESQL